MDTNELRSLILEEARQAGVSLSEDELNAKVLEASRMDPDKLERLNGGGKFFNCDKDYLCWSDYRCDLVYEKGIIIDPPVY